MQKPIAKLYYMTPHDWSAAINVAAINVKREIEHEEFLKKNNLTEEEYQRLSKVMPDEQIVALANYNEPAPINEFNFRIYCALLNPTPALVNFRQILLKDITS